MIPLVVLAPLIQQVALTVLTGGTVSIPLLITQLGEVALTNVSAEDLASAVAEIEKGLKAFFANVHSTMSNDEVTELFANIAQNNGS